MKSIPQHFTGLQYFLCFSPYIFSWDQAGLSGQSYFHTLTAHIVILLLFQKRHVVDNLPLTFWDTMGWLKEKTEKAAKVNFNGWEKCSHLTTR